MTYKDYELLVKDIVEGIAKLEGLEESTVQHNVQLTGKSGASHQIDVFWEFKLAGMTWRAVIQAKDWNKRVDFPTLNAFKGVLEDLGNPRGIMFTRTGYDKGNIEKVAAANQIELFVLDEYDKLLPEGPTPSMTIQVVQSNIHVSITGLQLGRTEDAKLMDELLTNIPLTELSLTRPSSRQQLKLENLAHDILRMCAEVELSAPEGAQIRYTLQESLLIEQEKTPDLRLTGLDATVVTLELDRQESTMFITHLVQTATGDQKFYVDNSFQVHHPGKMQHSITFMEDGKPSTVTAKLLEPPPAEERGQSA